QCRAQVLNTPGEGAVLVVDGGVEDLLDQAVVLVALDGTDRTGEEGAPTVSAELRGAAAQGVAVLVDQVGCGEIGGHVGSGSVRGHRACPLETGHTPGTPLSYWPVHQGSVAPSSICVPLLHAHRSFRGPERFKL